MRLPVHPSCTRDPRPLVNSLDERTSHAPASRRFRREQVLKITSGIHLDRAAVIEKMRETQ